MLSVYRHRIWRIPADIEKMKRKSRGIAKAFAAGRSWEQILASDGTLTDHDIFHALTEAPTSFWKKSSASSTKLPGFTTSVRTPVRHCRD
jgi:hypothetical protein